jgi:hypothetical protein
MATETGPTDIGHNGTVPGRIGFIGGVSRAAVENETATTLTAPRKLKEHLPPRSLLRVRHIVK